MVYSVTATATGPSSSFLLPQGEFAITLKSTLWGAVALEVSEDNSSWFTVEGPSGPVVGVTGNRLVEISGGLYYRLNVASYVQDIVMTAKAVGVFCIKHPDTGEGDLENYFFGRYFQEYHKSKLFVGETVTMPISLLKPDGSPADSLEGKDLKLVIEGSDQVDVAVFDSDALAIRENTITVELGPPVTDDAGVLSWSIREQPDNAVIAFGQFEVVYVPIDDTP